jgi:hypothetical protein
VKANLPTERSTNLEVEGFASSLSEGMSEGGLRLAEGAKLTEGPAKLS